MDGGKDYLAGGTTVSSAYMDGQSWVKSRMPQAGLKRAKSGCSCMGSQKKMRFVPWS